MGGSNDDEYIFEIGSWPGGNCSADICRDYSAGYIAVVPHGIT